MTAPTEVSEAQLSRLISAKALTVAQHTELANPGPQIRTLLETRRRAKKLQQHGGRTDGFARKRSISATSYATRWFGLGQCGVVALLLAGEAQQACPAPLGFALGLTSSRCHTVCSTAGSKDGPC